MKCDKCIHKEVCKYYTKNELFTSIRLDRVKECKDLIIDELDKCREEEVKE